MKNVLTIIGVICTVISFHRTEYLWSRSRLSTINTT